MRVIASDVIEIKFAISEEVHAKVLKLKGLLAHSDPNVSLSALFEKLCDRGVENWDPGKKAVRKQKTGTDAATKSPAAQQVLSGTKPAGPRANLVDADGQRIFIVDTGAQNDKSSHRKGISAQTKRDVWKREALGVEQMECFI